MADRLLPFDFDVVHVPGATLGTVDYMSRYPTYTTPLPSQYVELFVVKSIEAFINALNVINSSSQSERRSSSARGRRVRSEGSLPSSKSSSSSGNGRRYKYSMA